MKIKFKLRVLSALLFTVFMFSMSSVLASAGLVDSSAGGYDYLPVSGSDKGAAAPTYGETPPLSPAVNIIRNRFELKKPALVNSEVTFKPEEFEKILGIKKLKYITITKLPGYSGDC